MNVPNPPLPPGNMSGAGRILVRGIHFEMTSALRALAQKKAARLLRHHRRVIRVRIDVEQDHASRNQLRFVASGRIEISGPDLIALAAGDRASTAVDLLIEKLDRMLRERRRIRVDRRNNPRARIALTSPPPPESGAPPSAPPA